MEPQQVFERPLRAGALTGLLSIVSRIIRASRSLSPVGQFLNSSRMPSILPDSVTLIVQSLSAVSRMAVSSILAPPGFIDQFTKRAFGPQ